MWSALSHFVIHCVTMYVDFTIRAGQIPGDTVVLGVSRLNKFSCSSCAAILLQTVGLIWGAHMDLKQSTRTNVSVSTLQISEKVKVG